MADLGAIATLLEPTLIAAVGAGKITGTVSDGAGAPVSRQVFLLPRLTPGAALKVLKTLSHPVTGTYAFGLPTGPMPGVQAESQEYTVIALAAGADAAANAIVLDHVKPL